MRVSIVSMGRLTLAAIILTGCGLREAAPPAVPDGSPNDPAPFLSAPPGKQHVVLEAAYATARVDEVSDLSVVTSDSRTAEVTDSTVIPLCVTTPCSVNLTPGTHILRWTNPESPSAPGYSTVHVQSSGLAVRYAFGEYTQHEGRRGWAIGLFAAGGTIAVLGLPPFVLGNVLSTDNQDIKTGLTTGGTIALGVAGALLLAAVGFQVFASDTYQPSSMSQTPLGVGMPSGATPTAPGSEAGGSTSPSGLP